MDFVAATLYIFLIKGRDWIVLMKLLMSLSEKIQRWARTVLSDSRPYGVSAPVSYRAHQYFPWTKGKNYE